ncbi:3-deoxy-D-manno-octulosonic acid transferase [Ruixingdingia sedimenti]|uniref:3-deoxy-D-manno-octulosonic acid transferase n=1 Tax=Ruixingdingia sedimenti TaxID=3073604 RepID=A0ABU1F3Z9_9RHOB|nr:glycosyltransferase N-terminal domain-containing protein [Xinfangfangia sp. LG-4]MDR5651581.1 glycosyltransferase N-terminal domain-containing protein [Xinfangfangia sp. LG-4]
MPPTRLPLRLRLALTAYRLGWWLALPLVRAYFRRRARRDPRYGQHMDERLGGGPVLEGAVWVHAVSLGEMRSAVPLVRALLDRGARVVTTHLTPAGRAASEAAFGPEIAEGRLLARYLPLEQGRYWRRLYARARPRLWLVLEIEIWPVMIAEAAKAGVPLYLVNSQIPAKSWPRAQRLARWIGHPLRGVSGVLAKSARHAERFRALGAPGVSVGGELRFDQPIPPAQPAAAAALAPLLAGRPVVTLASVVAGEEDLYLDALSRLRERVPGLLAVWVPRAPELFDATAGRLTAAGLRVARRSAALDAALHAPDPAALAGADILLGDSMGEMYFYLALAQAVVVGGGFVPKGAHNIIEPLALRRPVLTGPHVWTIEYPGQEAQAEGVLTICPDAAALADRLAVLLTDPAAQAQAADRAEAFFAAHAGAAARTLARIAPLLEDRR